MTGYKNIFALMVWLEVVFCSHLQGYVRAMTGFGNIFALVSWLLIGPTPLISVLPK